MTTQHTTTAPQINAQPVSLVKSAPATYCSGEPMAFATQWLRYSNNLEYFAALLKVNVW